MPPTTVRPIRNPDARLRLLRRAATLALASDMGDVYINTAERLALRGLAVSPPRMLEYAHHLSRHRDIADGTIDPLDLLNEGERYVDADATRHALAREYEARVHADERLIAGITRPI